MASATSRAHRRMRKWALWMLDQQESLHTALKSAVPTLYSTMIETVSRFSVITYNEPNSAFTGSNNPERTGLSWMSPFHDKCMRFHFTMDDNSWCILHVPLDSKGGVYTVKNSYLRSNLMQPVADQVETKLLTTIQAWIDARMSLHRIRIRTRKVKEELMMNRWHPDRVMRLLDAGIDVENM